MRVTWCDERGVASAGLDEIQSKGASDLFYDERALSPKTIWRSATYRRVAHKSPISKRCRRRSASSCAFCERGIARARSDLPAKPLGARRLPQQRAQSGCKGLRRACTEQAGARGRGTGFEGSKPAAHLSKPSKTPNSSGDPRRKRTSNHPASWVASHQGRVRFMVRISAVRSRRHAVC